MNSEKTAMPNRSVTYKLIVLCAITVSFAGTLAAKESTPPAVETAIQQAGDNGDQIRAAWQQTADEHRVGMEFLLSNMPQRDLRALSSKYLLDNVRLAYQAWQQSPWEVPEDIFLNNILPYASINESRDDFRQDFMKRFQDLVKDAKSTSEAATILNRQVFKQLNVKYSRQRRRADQGPTETIETGKASCTGLSVLLIDACRSVGVPARFVGTPLWSDRSGNHSWVEVWDQDGWHFTGAAEPTGDDLDKGWFTKRSSMAKRDVPLHAIYATSFKKTPLAFPMVWNRSIRDVPAINVTDRYAGKQPNLPEDHLYARFQVCDVSGRRQQQALKVLDEQGKLLFDGKTKDERFDGNDHTTVVLPVGKQFQVKLGDGQSQTITTQPGREQLFTFRPQTAAASTDDTSDAAESTTDATGEDSGDAVEALRKHLKTSDSAWESLSEQKFASQPLTKPQADAAEKLLLAHRRSELREQRQAELEKKQITIGDRTLPIFYKVYGKKPAGGRSLYISMHGGGGAPARVNDQQWQNQKRLYRPEEGVYVAPRAPTNSWNLWHEGHIMGLFDRLIEDLVLLEDVNPNRVYVMGYSAGGDGVYQLAPRMADRWAAASMMAGHPNNARPENLRNIGFAIYMGGLDRAYKRNQIAAEWKVKLQKLQEADPQGYRHQVTIYPKKGHWMDREDASAVPWMAKFRRNPLPEKIVWRKDGQEQPRFYWLGRGSADWAAGSQQIVSRDGQNFTVSQHDAAAPEVTLLLNDDLVDLDKPVQLTVDGKPVQVEQPQRTIAAMHRSLTERFDPAFVYRAAVSAKW